MRPNSRETVAFAMGTKEAPRTTATQAAGAAATSYPPSVLLSIRNVSLLPPFLLDRLTAAWPPPSPLHAGGRRAEEGATGAGGVIKLDVQDKGRNIGDADAADAIAVQPGYMVHVPGDEGGPSRENEDEEMS